MCVVQSTPLSEAFITTQEGLGQGNDGIKASSDSLYKTVPCIQDSLAPNRGINYSVTTVNQGLGKEIPIGGCAVWQNQCN